METDAEIAMNPNRLVQHLNKAPDEFTKADIIRFMEENQFEGLNFRYVTGSGKLKTLNFMVTSKAQLDRLLSAGERVDGSSLFSHIDASGSDLYVIPRFRTAYVNPFAPIPTLDILCGYYTCDGEPYDCAPEQVLARAHRSLRDATGLNFEALGELEYYVVHEPDSLYPEEPQKGYHNSAPFSKWERLRVEAMQAIAQAGGKPKYGHSEVGHVQEAGQAMEQAEIEFSPVPVEDAADQLVVAKWMLRMVAYKYGVTVTFAPKIIVGHAGSGLHVHTRLLKDGKSAMLQEGRLSDTARRAIAGYLKLAPSLTAFGNTVPTSYLRLVPNHEAPTNVCWGERNRSALVRVPLGWTGVRSMVNDANPLEKGTSAEQVGSRQTVEVRSPDGSANVHLLLAGLAVAAREGLQMPDALDLAEKLYVAVNIFAKENKAIQKALPSLPASCWESADVLLRDRQVYEQDGVFPAELIDGTAEKLKSYEDRRLRQDIRTNAEWHKQLVNRFLHC